MAPEDLARFGSFWKLHLGALTQTPLWLCSPAGAVALVVVAKRAVTRVVDMVVKEAMVVPAELEGKEATGRCVARTRCSGRVAEEPAYAETRNVQPSGVHGSRALQCELFGTVSLSSAWHISASVVCRALSVVGFGQVVECGHHIRLHGFENLVLFRCGR